MKLFRNNSTYYVVCDSHLPISRKNTARLRLCAAIFYIPVHIHFRHNSSSFPCSCLLKNCCTGRLDVLGCSRLEFVKERKKNETVESFLARCDFTYEKKWREEPSNSKQQPLFSLFLNLPNVKETNITISPSLPSLFLSFQKIAFCCDKLKDLFS